VYLFEPNRTQFDINWQMFGIPVRVHPMFWLMGAVTGWIWLQYGFEYLFAWIACVFVSVLIHELGHIFMGRVFGARGHIVLYGFGGLAIGSNTLANRWQRIAVSFAGPLAGFLYLGLIIVVVFLVAPNEFAIMIELLKYKLGMEYRRELLPQKLSMTEFVFLFLVIINVGWGLLNLLPVWPLDGGQMSRDFAGWINPTSGERIALGISLVVSGLIAVHGISIVMKRPLLPILTGVDGTFLAIMFGLLALGSFQQLQELNQRPWREDWPSRWDRDQDDWRR
jgi:stage IV sporulation protein FB